MHKLSVALISSQQMLSSLYVRSCMEREQYLWLHVGVVLLLGSLAMSGPILAAQVLPTTSSLIAAGPSDAYPLGRDSLPQNVPHGKTFVFTLDHSTVFPDTSRKITVYVPAEYTDAEPACVYVGLDGLSFNVPVVFDNLIARHAMPVTIAIGVAPGTVLSPVAVNDPRHDRSFEFDSMTPRLAEFLLQDVLPEVERRGTPDGKPIRLSTRADDRAIGGASTGGVGAFNVAWQRPDAFRRVFSAIGTYVGMRGAQDYYVLVRKSEPKPIRVFLQDGTLDEWPGGPEMGDWWMSNQTMERALTFAGYDVRHEWGTGTHNGTHATAIFPEAMQWLWRDWPAAIAAGAPGNPALSAVLDPSHPWTTMPAGCPGMVRLVAAPDGTVYDGMALGNLIALKNQATRFCRASPVIAAFTSSPLTMVTATHVASGTKLHYTGEHPRVVLLPHLWVHDLIVRENGDVYVTATNGEALGEIWLVRSDGRAKRVANGLTTLAGIALSPDKAWLVVAQQDLRNGWNYRVRADGTLDSGVLLYELFTPSSSSGSKAGSVAMDRDGRAYVATAEGVEIFDHNGRVTGILALPSHRGATSLCFGGSDVHDLYVTDGEYVFVRTLKSTGAPAWAPASPVPNWGAG